MTELVIKVTQAHIDNGDPREAFSCPVALALTDMGYYDVSVGYQTASGNNSRGHQMFHFDVSPEMGAFILDFDGGGDLPAPATFTVSPWREHPSILEMMNGGTEDAS